MDYKLGYLQNIEVKKGMFPEERTVIATTYGGGVVSGFFHKNLIVKGKGLEVYLLERKEDRVLIKPRGGEFLNHKRILVSKNNLHKS